VRGVSAVPRTETAVRASQRGVYSTALTAAAAHAEQQQSIALLGYHDGKLQYEQYWQGTGRDSFFNPQSMSKPVLGMMVGIAIRDGHIGGVDESVDRYLFEWRDDPRGEITIAQLLQMSNGLAQISTSYAISLDNPAVYHHFGTDFVGPILNLALVDTPGTKWDDNNNEANLFGVILERASG
jgi:CubicO group peptidase (beta-lactamase class C family)